MGKNSTPRVLTIHPELKWFLESFYRVNCEVLKSPQAIAANVGTFDVLVFGDYHRLNFDMEPGCLDRVVNAIRNGVSLFCFGGWESYGAGGYLGTSLAELLPVEIQEDDVRSLRHDIAGITWLGDTRFNQLDAREVPMATSYNLFREVKEEDIVIAEREVRVDEGNGEINVPMIVYRDYGDYKVLCTAMSLVGGGAKDLIQWPLFPALLRLCLEQTWGHEVEPIHEIRSMDAFRHFLQRFHLAKSRRDQEHVLGNALLDRWFDEYPVEQYRLVGDLAGRIRSEVVVKARIFMLPHLVDDETAFTEREVEIYKYRARHAANVMRFNEASVLYAMASAVQRRLEEGPKGVLKWSYYFRGMSKLCEAMEQ